MPACGKRLCTIHLANENGGVDQIYIYSPHEMRTNYKILYPF